MLRKKLVSLFIISSFFSVNFINHGATAKVQPSNFFQYIPIVRDIGNNNQSTDVYKQKREMFIAKEEIIQQKAQEQIEKLNSTHFSNPEEKLRAQSEIGRQARIEVANYGRQIGYNPASDRFHPDINLIGANIPNTSYLDGRADSEVVSTGLDPNISVNKPVISIPPKATATNTDISATTGTSLPDSTEVGRTRDQELRDEFNSANNDLDNCRAKGGNCSEQEAKIKELADSKRFCRPEPGLMGCALNPIFVDETAREAARKVTPVAVEAAKKASGLEPSTGIEAVGLNSATQLQDKLTQQSVEDAMKSKEKLLREEINNQGTGIEASGLGLNSATQLKDKLTEQSVQDARQKAITDKTNNQGSGIEASGLGLNSATQLKDKLTEQSVQAARQRRIDWGMEAETDPNISVNKPTVPDSQAVKDAKTIADAKALSNKTNVNRSVYLPNSSQEKELQAALARTGKEYPTVRDDYAHQSDAPAKASKDDSRKTEFDGDSDKPATVSLNKKDKKQGERIELAKDVDGFYGEEGAGGSFAADKFTKDQKYSLGKAGTKDTKFPTSLPSGTFEEAQALADQLGANIPTTGNIVIPNPLTGALVSVPAEMATCLFSGGANCVGDAVKGLVKDYAGKIFGQVFGTGMLGQVANGAVTGGVSGALNGDILGGVQNGAMGGLTGSLQDQVGGALNGLTANAEVLSVAQQASTAAFGCMTQGQCNPTDMAQNVAMGAATNAVNNSPIIKETTVGNTSVRELDPNASREKLRKAGVDDEMIDFIRDEGKYAKSI